MHVFCHRSWAGSEKANRNVGFALRVFSVFCHRSWAGSRKANRNVGFVLRGFLLFRITASARSTKANRNVGWALRVFPSFASRPERGAEKQIVTSDSCWEVSCCFASGPACAGSTNTNRNVGFALRACAPLIAAGPQQRARNQTQRCTCFLPLG